MDSTVQRSVISQLAERPESLEIGPFVIGWDPGTDSRSINYATPHPDATITTADVAALVGAFRAIGRIPRLEYVTSSAPELERHLLDAGFTVEERHDYLVCLPATLIRPATPDGIELAEPATDADRADLVAAQNEAFGGEPAATPADVARVRRTQDRGGVVILARFRTRQGASDGDTPTAGTGATDVARVGTSAVAEARARDGAGVGAKAGGGFPCAGGGQAAPIRVGVTEVAAIAVRPAFRRRGIASAVTAAITASAFERGADATWLEASGPDSWRVYERLGYVATGKRLYIALG